MKNFAVFNLERHRCSEPDSVVSYVFDTLDQRCRDRMIDQDVKIVIGTILWESYYFQGDNLSEIIQVLAQALETRSISLLLIVDHYYQDQGLFPDIPVYYIDFFQWRAYDLTLGQIAQDLNPRWNAHSDRVLFLTGKPLRLNRLRLLWKLSGANLLPRTTWSLFMTPELKERCRYLIPELDDAAYGHFCDSHQRNPDGIEIEHTHEKDVHYGGFPFDQDLYSGSRLRLLSETHFRDTGRPFVSEKTWTTIANRLPFVIAGDVGTLALLRRRGYRTYENFCVLPAYDSIADAEARLDAVVTNTQHFLNDRDRDAEIQIDVEHNFDLFLRQSLENKQVLDYIITRYDLADACLSHICPTDRFYRNW